MKKVRLILYGVGALGSHIAKFLLQKEGVEIVGAIDVAEDKVGVDLGKVLGLGGNVGVTVSADPEAVFSKVKADAVVHATTSFLQQTYPQIAKALKDQKDGNQESHERGHTQGSFPEKDRSRTLTERVQRQDEE